ncbi:MAG: hypothetical protein J0M33_05510 [Anaerolineae bacterium]|nr:hypothetical protein [Anaerolineae bacterium]
MRQIAFTRSIVTFLILLVLLGVSRSGMQAQSISENDVYAVAWSPDGSKIAGVILNAVMGLQFSSAQTQDEIFSVVWSSDGSMIAISGGVVGCDDTDPNRFPIRIFSATTGLITKLLYGMTCTSTGLDLSPDGQKLVSFNFAQSTAYIWNVVNGNLLLTVPFESQGMLSVDWSPNSNRIASAFPGDFIVIWDSDTGQVIEPILRGSISAWSPDSSRIAIGNSNSDAVSIVDVDTGNILLSLIGATDATNSIDWSQDGSHVAVGSADNKVRIWNVGSGQLTSTFNVSNIVADVNWSPNGQAIAVAGFDSSTSLGIVSVLDVASGSQLSSFTQSERLLSVAWSPDGAKLAFGGRDGIVKIMQAFAPPQRNGAGLRQRWGRHPTASR